MLKCPSFSSASNRIIAAKDHASIQLNFADVDESTGRMTGSYKTYAVCGAIRRMGPDKGGFWEVLIKL